MKILHLSIFLNHKIRHGGTRRSEQIKELLENTESISINPYCNLKSAVMTSVKFPYCFLEALAFSCYMFMAKGISFRGFVKFSIFGGQLIKELKDNEFDILLHETAPGISIIFMHYLQWKRIKYIAIPHNIEYLVPGQTLGIFNGTHNLYQIEVGGYKSADLVMTICDFDAAVLRCNGVNAHVLKYRPIFSDREKFQSIKKFRANKDSFENFLLLGSIDNLPTLNGVKNLLENAICSNDKLKIIVAGYGTEKLSSYESINIKILGSVSNEAIENLLKEVSAVLINQPQTSGFLTKIIEMNLCGVPQIVVSEYFQATGLKKFGIIKSKIELLSCQKIPKKFEAFPQGEISSKFNQYLDLACLMKKY